MLTKCCSFVSSKIRRIKEVGYVQFATRYISICYVLFALHFCIGIYQWQLCKTETLQLLPRFRCFNIFNEGNITTLTCLHICFKWILHNIPFMIWALILDPYTMLCDENNDTYAIVPRNSILLNESIVWFNEIETNVGWLTCMPHSAFESLCDFRTHIIIQNYAYNSLTSGTYILFFVSSRSD